MKIRSLLSVCLLSSGLVIMGCATRSGNQGNVKLPPGDQLKIAEITPSMGGELTHDQQVKVRVAYRLKSSEEAVVLTRPFNGGRQSKGYMAHAPVTCLAGKGVAETWFTFRKDSAVDEIRVTLADTKAGKILRVITNSYQASWSAAQ